MEKDENQNLEYLENDDSLTFMDELKEKNTASQIMNASDMTLDQATEFIKKVFGVTQGSRSSDDSRGGHESVDIPEFIVTAFAEAHREQKLTTLNKLSEAFLDAAHLGDDDSGMAVSELTSDMIDTLIEDILPPLTTFYAIATANRDVTANKTLQSNFFTDISVLKAVLTEDRMKAISDDNSGTNYNNLDENFQIYVAEIIIFVNELELMDDDLNEDMFDQDDMTAIYDHHGESGESFSVMEDFDEVQFVMELGLIDSTDLTQSITVQMFDVRPMDYWSDNGSGEWVETSVLSAWVDIMAFGYDSSAIGDVKLQYVNTSGAVSSVTLSSMDDMYGSMDGGMDGSMDGGMDGSMDGGMDGIWMVVLWTVVLSVVLKVVLTEEIL